VKLVSYKHRQALEKPWRAGLKTEAGIVDVVQALPGAPASVQGLLEEWGKWRPKLAEAAIHADQRHMVSEEEAVLGSPLLRPPSFRDFYAFEAHVKTARERRGLAMVPEWYRFPVFYFSNAAAFIGPDEEVVRPAATQWLDYELEIACVIGEGGVDIPVERADEHIAGFCILNDWSARDLQREEVKVGLGPAKGKDFATSMGPWLVTPDELNDLRIPGEKGDRYDLSMVARVNGIEYSRGNFRDIYYTFAEMIARASADCPLYPGDVIGSGTVGTGCILELGAERYPWLQPGDVVELEVERLGILRNRIVEKRRNKQS
jgi:fumarylacetoacetate (FAA) hydrolase